ncbi:spore coat protein A [Sphaerisporangium krabiense]|uniref:FtsP/CotA-like multicopper oxidase with cupredoxin domain n=1 Tax=Sphaerisporangium krabiense TaxID=763782 RepID=A0A7W9DP16_9ACTN|nr:multicopper oxidase family protein [Sphaerisporangium krabiense]MBB5624820.1 FtsP/CotA-like multicopper oxidase with cupredoxin domain [Sphaerisporangium krabiense]GII66480.1 spore coat protein A [Sphaerisporangium krabiense]
MLNRRRLLALGAITGGAMVLPFSRLTAEGADDTVPLRRQDLIPRAPRAAARSAVAPFSVRMPVPQELRPAWSGPDHDLYKIAVKPANLEILPGLTTPLLTYGGTFVGPTIRARTGRPAKVVFVNQLDRPTNVHLHGAHVPAVSDGHPMETIDPGRFRSYDYPNAQQGTTLWYHDHSHHMEAEHVYRGLHGMYVIDDPAERRLRLPDGPYDVPIFLRNAQFDENGGLVFFSPYDRTTILANGRPQPYFPVAARKYRFRLVNGANEYTFRLTLGGAEFQQIASDGGLLPAPVPLTELVLGSAQRADIVVDFARYPVGTQVVLTDAASGAPVLRFDVVRQAWDDSRVPDVLRPLPPMPAATVRREVSMRFGYTETDVFGLVNDKQFDPNRVDFRIKRGDTEIWTLTNGDSDQGIEHTFHMHLVQFRVLDRNGAPPRPWDAGLKDTIQLPPNETVRVQATFRNYLGRYVYHCHYLEHSSLGMMAQMEVVP